MIDHPDQPEEELWDPSEPRRPWYQHLRRPTKRDVPKIIGIAVALSSFAVWVYAYSGKAGRTTPDTLDNPAFAQQAEPVCAAAMDDLAAMPQAYDAKSGQERSGQIQASTARLETMVADLQTQVGGSPRDVQILNSWLGDWRTAIGDRYRYAAAIAADPGAQYLMSATGGNELLDTRITRMADTNRMSSCAMPGDVG